MANTVAMSRAQLMYGICLPLAVLLGFFLADPLELSALAIVGMVLAVLCAPLLIKWHHPMLILSWHASVAISFLPGNPTLWMLLAMLSLICGLVNRSTDPHRRFLSPPAVTWSLAALLVVTVVTVALTGGVGSRALGSSQFGGSRLFGILFAIAGFFALTSQGIPREHARLYAMLFLLPGLTALAGHLIYLVGPGAYPLFSVFPSMWAIGQAAGTERVDAFSGGTRLGGFGPASLFFLCFLLARYGVRGLFKFTRPWRFGFLAATLVGVLYSGYRTWFILFLLTFVLVFFLEGLHRTRFALLMLGGGVVLGLLFLPLVPRLPYVVQRSLAWLPVKVSPGVRADVRNSNQWRLDMWRDVLPELPAHLLVGKGYAIDPRELSVTVDATWRREMGQSSVAKLAGDYHNGPLSVLVPLGGIGALAFLWFLIAGGAVLFRNCRYGNPDLRFINRLLLAFFLARVIFFLFVFGTFWQDFMLFAGLVGFGLSLNAEAWSPTRESMETSADPLAVGYVGGDPRRVLG